MKLIISLTFMFLFSFSIQAEEIKDGQVISMIDQMVAKGIIPKADAEAAKIKMKHITPEQWAGINKQAQAMAQKYQAQNRTVSSNSVEAAAHNIDFDGPMFQDIRKNIQGQTNLAGQD